MSHISGCPTLHDLVYTINVRREKDGKEGGKGLHEREGGRVGKAGKGRVR